MHKVGAHDVKKQNHAVTAKTTQILFFVYLGLQFDFGVQGPDIFCALLK